MRAVAEFTMRGRLQAAIVALIGNWVPLLTPAAVALVTLRAGWHNGVLISLWGVLPAVLMLGFSQIDPLVPIVVVNGVVLTFLLALVLGSTGSWARSLMAAVALATLMALGQLSFMPETVEVVIDNLARMTEQMQTDEADNALAPLGKAFAVGLIAYVIAFSSTLGLIVGRWWQALLYNPGGFAEEFRTLKLSAPQAVVCMAAGIYSLFQGPDYSIWSALFTLPLLFAGLAIVHRVVALKKLGVQWLVLFYIALFVLDPVSQLLVVLAFLDTWLDVRGRVQPKA